MNPDDEAEQKERELIASAEAADADTEAKLARLKQLAEARRPDPEIEAEYEALRNELAAQLQREGVRYFIGADGEKHYAHTVQPEPVEVNMDALLAEYEAGHFSEEVFEAIAPRKPDKDRIRAMVARKKIPPASFVRFAKIRKGTAFVRFVDPHG